MGYTFTYGDVERICRSLRLRPQGGTSRHWAGVGRDGRLLRVRLDSHGAGRETATGTARSIARQLKFRDLQEMYEYLRRL